jgi:hypothetical protein
MIVLTCDRCGKTIESNEKLYDMGFAPWHHTASGYKINLDAARYPEGLQLCEECLEDIIDYAYQSPENKCECCVEKCIYDELVDDEDDDNDDDTVYKTSTNLEPEIGKFTYDAELSALEKLKEQFSNKVNNLNQKATPSEKVASSNISHEDELTKKYNDFIETMTEQGYKTFGDILSGVHNFCNKLTDEDRDFINKMVMKDLKKTIEEMF